MIDRRRIRLHFGVDECAHIWLTFVLIVYIYHDHGPWTMFKDLERTRVFLIYVGDQMIISLMKPPNILVLCGIVY